MSRARERDLEPDKLHALLDEVTAKKMTMRTVLAPMTSSLTPQGKMVVMSALVALAPARLPAQRKVIEEAGATLGLSKADIAAILTPSTVS